jgi:hypothetical protein
MIEQLFVYSDFQVAPPLLPGRRGLGIPELSVAARNVGADIRNSNQPAQRQPAQRQPTQRQPTQARHSRAGSH